MIKPEIIAVYESVKEEKKGELSTFEAADLLLVAATRITSLYTQLVPFEGDRQVISAIVDAERAILALKEKFI